MSDSQPEAGQETKQFGTDVERLMRLVTHSLYSNKEIFLRELVSNASDALDKLRFSATNDQALYESDPELKITIDIDKDLKTVTVKDNGIGMSRDDVVAHLGTIAKSGTKDFLDNLPSDGEKDSEMIGQFGVGFYSAFIVADKVIVRTRRAGMQSEQGVEWMSNGSGTYDVQNINMPQRGTEIVLFLKDDEAEFLESHRLRNIISKYSDHILAPIMMQKPEKAEADDSKEAKQEATTPEYEQINSAKALWTMSKSEVKDEEYNELYKHISHDFEDPIAWAHNKVEGNLVYTTLLYVPARAPMDLWNREMQRGLKLYVRKVFIMDDAEQFLPFYLRFVRGIVDSNDLPLNVSRELLQSNRTITKIKSACTKRILSMLEKMAENDKEKYQKFWEVFGQVMKEGPAEDMANRDQIAKLLRFHSTAEDSGSETVTLTDYVSRMKSEQKKIYYLIADSYQTAKGSPLLEAFRKRDVEVLLLKDRVDEWLVSHLTEFDGKGLQSIAKGELDLTELGEEKDPKSKAEKEKDAKAFTKTLECLMKHLSERVKEVRLTDRLIDSPACVVYDDQDSSGHLQRLMAAAGQAMPPSKPILELNPEHPLVSQLTKLDDKLVARWSEILLGQSLLAEGEQLEDPQAFIREVNSLLAVGAQ